MKRAPSCAVLVGSFAVRRRGARGLARDPVLRRRRGPAAHSRL